MGETYSKAGVDINSENRTIKTIISALRSTFDNRKGKIGNVVPSEGHFANYIEIGEKYFVLCSDGVGTKVLVAQMMDKYDTIAIDMIAMNVNDMICVGAEPLALVDYLAVEKHDEELISELSRGLVDGANQAGIAIIGGETATLKGVVTGYDGKGFDLAGSCLGIVHKENVITGEKMAAGDFIVGLQSSGIHSNGLSLARKILLEDRTPQDILYDDVTVGEALLAPTRIYVKPVLEMLENYRDCIRAIYNITGSGFMKFNRLKKAGFMIEKLLPIPKIFARIKEEGNVDDKEMFKTFNMGLGMALVTDKPEHLIDISKKHGIHADVIGRIDDSDKITIKEKNIVYEF